MGQSPVSLKQIAQEANVSVTTVSRVLRNRGEISQATRQRVLDIAAKLRYRPNLTAQSIYSGKSDIVGVIIPAAWTFDMRIAFGIHDELAEHDMVPITLWTGGEDTADHNHRVENVLRQVHHLVDRRVDAVIVRPEATARDVYVKEIIDRGIPLVTVDRNLLESQTDFVGTDDMVGATLAAEHLIGLGHRRLAHIAGHPGATTGKIRREAFEQTVARTAGAHCQTIEDLTFGHDPNIAVELLSGSDRPTAIFAANDFIARHVYDAAHQLNIRIPEDLSVIGFADLEFASILVPPLTTVRQFFYEIGRRAARLVVQRRDGQQQRDPQTILIKPELIARDSTAAPRD